MSMMPKMQKSQKGRLGKSSIKGDMSGVGTVGYGGATLAKATQIPHLSNRHDLNVLPLRKLLKG